MALAKSRIVRNTSILMIGQALSWGLTLILTLYLPRYLGVANIGKYQLASSLWAIVSILATFGMDTYLTREVAQDHSRLNRLFSQSIMVRMALFILGAAGLAIYTQYADYAADTKQVILIISLAILVNLINGALSASIQALERMEYLALGAVLLNATLTSLSMIAILTGQGLYTIVWIANVVALGNFIYLSLILRRLHRLRLDFSFENIRGFLFTSISFFLLNVFILLYQQVDIIVISWFVNEKGVGWYGVANRLTGTLGFIPSVFMTVFLPTFSRLSVEDPVELIKLFRKAYHFMLLIGVGLGFGMFVVATQIVTMIYGPEFANSGPILSIRGIVVIFTFLNVLLGIYLMSINRQKQWIFVMASAFLLTIPLDINLVPYFERTLQNGAVGGAFSFLITEIGITIAGISLLPKKTFDLDTLSYSIRALLAGACMAAGIWWLREKFLLIPILAGVVLYLILAIILRLITREEWLFMQGMLSSIVNKIYKKAARRMKEI